ncbi:hypothetical protein LCGC14_2832770 [marine sediment metagenome]|uniref:Uncharacterized protein n=1 Tax=marine sediment metagenome TaxID=412755 RepID=A0A0F8YDI1_9ZZZZ
MPDPRIFPIPNVTDTFVAVAATTTQVLAANDNRLGAEFVNDSPDVIYLARGNDAVVGSGIRLNPNGGSYGMETSNLFLGIINAISDGDEANLTVSEEYGP